MTAENWRGGPSRDVARLERAFEKLSARVAKIERGMWIMTGTGGATVLIATYNLVANLQQATGR